MAHVTTTTNTSGESNVAFDYTVKGGSDCVSDKVMAEITRRIQGFIQSDELGEVVFSPDEPNSKLKIWIETDATGAIIGTIKRYDSSTGKWVDDHTVLPSTQLKMFIKSDTISSNDQVITYSHNLATTNYFYTITYKTSPLTGARWFQQLSDANDLAIRYLDLSGVQVEVKIIEITNQV